MLYDIARKLNKRIKAIRGAEYDRTLSPVRRIERVCTNERVVAMTFDDGPCADFCGERGLTNTILDILADFSAKGTFDIIGDTSENYPDEAGAEGGFSWSGKRYDHYPRFGSDSQAGAKNQPDLVRRMIADGHELSNHGYTHRLFGPMRAVYGERRHFEKLSEVVNDLSRLDSLVSGEYGVKMKLARPPHYIDNIPHGGNSYDAYRILGYQYLAASFDGAGWQVRVDEAEEISDMTEPLRRALAENADALRGQIIFQKDGCNMAHRVPVAAALPTQLKLLADAGYRVVTVSELLALSPLADLSSDAECAPFVRQILGAGHIAAYRNNAYHAERDITAAEFNLMCLRPEHFAKAEPLSARALYAEAEARAILPRAKKFGNAILAAADKYEITLDDSDKFDGRARVSRGDAAEVIAKLIAADRQTRIFK